MKIFFDARYIKPDFHDGISRYTAELSNGVARQISTKDTVTFLISDKAQLKLLPKNSKYILLHPTTSAKEVLTSLILNKYKPDVVFSPMQTMGSQGRKFKLILTLHDLIYYQHHKPPTQLNVIIRIGWRLYHTSYVPGRLVLNSADIVATVSETVKKQFKDVRITKRPVEVITNAPEDLRKLTDKQVNLKNKPRNLIYMGSFMPYKNVELLIEALQYLPNNYTLHLLSHINPKRKAELRALIPEGKKVIFHGGVTDQKYANILADDAIMVNTSKSEGFGLPVVEALKMGIPTIVSDMEIFHEVGGDGVLYCTTAEQLAAHVKSLDDEKLRRDLVKKGQKHIEKFDWDKSAVKLLNVMAEITKV